MVGVHGVNLHSIRAAHVIKEGHLATALGAVPDDSSGVGVGVEHVPGNRELVHLQGDDRNLHTDLHWHARGHRESTKTNIA